MTATDLLGARIALGWSALLTATGPGEACGDRRAEIASDVFEQVAAAGAVGQSNTRLSWSITGRALRGVPRDIAWRVQLEAAPARWEWHLRHPSTMLTFLLVTTVPITLVADGARTRIPRLHPIFDLLWAVTLAMCWVMLAFATAAGAHRVHATGASLPSSAHTWVTQLARGVTALMAISWAASGIGRFVPGSILFHALSTVAWAIFGASLLAYLVLLLARSGAKLLTLGRYRPKVGS